jgi:hypothetical protein
MGVKSALIAATLRADHTSNAFQAGRNAAELVVVTPATAFEGKTTRGNLGWWWLRVRGRHGP